MAVVAPMPKASVMTAVVVNPGVFASRRRAARTSVIRCPYTLSTGRTPCFRSRFPSRIRMNRRAVSKIVRALFSGNTVRVRFWLRTPRPFREPWTGIRSIDLRRSTKSRVFWKNGKLEGKYGSQVAANDALLTTCVGLYGTMSYSLARHMGEIKPVWLWAAQGGETQPNDPGTLVRGAVLVSAAILAGYAPAKRSS